MVTGADRPLMKRAMQPRQSPHRRHRSREPSAGLSRHRLRNRANPPALMACRSVEETRWWITPFLATEHGSILLIGTRPMTRLRNHSIRLHDCPRHIPRMQPETFNSVPVSSILAP